MASIPTAIPLPNNLLRPVQTRHSISSTLFPFHRLRRHTRSTPHISSTSAPNNPHRQKHKPQKRSASPTLFPGGYKRPEIKIPTLVLKVTPEEVLGSVDRRAEIDVAVSKGVVGIVVLESDSGGGGRVYEAAGALKTVVGDRAYVVLEDRVDVAAAVGASGVLLSDHGLPAIVARNVMSKSTSESVLLPLVARRVQSAGDAVSASSFDGADFLIISTDMEKYTKVLDEFVVTLDIKIPFFFAVVDMTRGDSLYITATKLLQSGASGMILSLDDLNWLSDGVLKNLFQNASKVDGRIQSKGLNSDELTNTDTGRKEHVSKQMVAGFTKLGEREIQFIETERSILLEAVATIRRTAPLMVDVSLLVDAISRLDQPFLMAIIGEFNSGKSTVINALLGRSYLKDGVVPTTNEITLLCYSDTDSTEQERCERHPDGQFICYLSAPILKEMNLVDTPGTNVILQRQQRLTEEYIPRADLVLFVLSSDRPLTESEVDFLLYVRQWKKRVVFVLNKSDLYRNTSELEEAMEFIKVNVTKMLNTENMELYPVSARSALEAKLSISSYIEDVSRSALSDNPLWMSSGFSELENFLFSFLDGSTDTGMERMRLKCGTPIAIADRLLDSCERLMKQDYESACKDLSSINEMINSVQNYAMNMENQSLFWKKQTLSLIDGAKTRAVNLIESTLQLSNIDLLISYAFKREISRSPSATISIKNDIISPALSDTQKLLGEYVQWLESSTAQESQQYFKDFDEKWPGFISRLDQVHSDTNALLNKQDKISVEVARNFSTSAAARLFDQEISEVVLATYGGLGVSSLSASLLTSVLPTTMEDLLALALCSAGGFYAISNFPGRRKNAIVKVTKVADALAKEIEDAMNEDLSVAMEKLQTFVELTGKPYQEAAQNKIDRLSEIQSELDTMQQKIQGLKTEIQSLHVL